jgi:3-dehydro-L-gulonate 2-dehydrogenase
MLRVPFPELELALRAALEPFGFTPEGSALTARIFAETTCDGVYTHGLARFPRFIKAIQLGVVDPSAEPSVIASFGALERWDGRCGAGVLNAHAAMNRAMQLAREHGLGAVFLANTNHWMRGGTYGWQAADAGLFAICFTNTLPNLPAWGTAIPSLGNNPLVLAVPRPQSQNVVLDMAMSQYSYGTLGAYKARGEQLPYPGGFDQQGNLTSDPKAITDGSGSGRALPIGLWKGSGLALTLDLFAAMLSGGKSTHEISRDPLRETALSQCFLAIDPTHLATDREALDSTADAILANLASVEPIDPAKPARYPGEQTLRTRKENMRLGVPVEESHWQQLLQRRYE